MSNAWDRFYDHWGANFRKLSADDGLTAWSEFVEKCDWPILKQAIDQLGEKYADDLEDGKRPSQPTLPVVRKRYWKLKPQREQTGNTRCAICNGGGIVCVTGPAMDDVEERKWWPEDYHDMLPRRFNGVETTRCPQCFPRYYPDDVRRRVTEHCVPLTIRRGDRMFPQESFFDDVPGYVAGSCMWIEGRILIERWVAYNAKRRRMKQNES